MKLRVVSESTEEAISIDECMAHLRANFYGDTATDAIEETMVLGWLKAAREWAEQFTGLSFLRREYEGALDEFPEDYIEIPVGPVLDVTSITTGQATSSSSDDTEVGFVFDDFSEPARLYPEGALAWPVSVSAVNGIRIRFVAGYGVESDTPVMPWTCRAAILLILGHLYANRETNVERALSEVPMGAKAFLRQSRVRLGMA